MSPLEARIVQPPHPEQIIIVEKGRKGTISIGSPQIGFLGVVEMEVNETDTLAAIRMRQDGSDVVRRALINNQIFSLLILLRGPKMQDPPIPRILFKKY